MSITAAIFFGAWRRVVKRAGGARAIPLLWRLVPERWRGEAQDAADKELRKVGK